MTRFFLLAVLLALLSLTSAQRPASTSICVYYTMATNGAVDNATGEYNLISGVVGRAALGGTYGPTRIDGIVQSPTTTGQTNPIIGYFNGQIVFRMNPNNPDYTANNFNNSNFATLASHLYSYFGALLGCNYIGTTPFGPVANSDMYGVHATMNLTQTQMNYFDTAVANSLTSFGVAAADVTAAASALAIFNQCGPQIQGNKFIDSSARNQICDAPGTLCTPAPNANCGLYNGALSKATVSVLGAVMTVVAVLSMLL